MAIIKYDPLPDGRTPELYRRDAVGAWRCVECGHLPDEHYPEPRPGEPGGWYECSQCNCGNNGR